MLRTELIRPLPELLRAHADRFGDKIAYSDTRRDVSYADLEQRTRRLAGHLAELGLQPGDRAAIYLGNCVEAVESYFTITRASGIGVPLNPRASDAELAYFLDDSGAKVIITDGAHLDQLRRVLQEGRELSVVVTGAGGVPENAPAGAVSFEALSTSEPATPARDDLGLDDPAWMLYTSGTTGRPKGVLSAQHGCLWLAAACYVPILGLSSTGQVDLASAPLSLFRAHPLCSRGNGGGRECADHGRLLSRRRTGGRAYGGVTFLAGVPTMYHYLLEAARKNGLGAHRLRFCLAVARPVPRRCESRLSSCSAFRCWMAMALRKTPWPGFHELADRHRGCRARWPSCSGTDRAAGGSEVRSRRGHGR